jgi:hypothetical protein
MLRPEDDICPESVVYPSGAFTPPGFAGGDDVLGGGVLVLLGGGVFTFGVPLQCP